MTSRTRVFQCPADHAHAANLNCYTTHACGCDDCVVGNREYVRRVSKLRAYNRFGGERLDGNAVREHLNYLLANGMGSPTVSRITGISARTVQGIRQNRCRRVQRRNVDAILAIQPTFDLLAGGVFVAARGTRRRLQALVAAGWTQTRIATEFAGRPVQAVNQLLYGTEMVTARTHREVAEMFEHLSSIPAPRDGKVRYGYTKAIRLGARHGWVPPLQWDDIDNDPTPAEANAYDATVDLRAVELAVTGVKGRLNAAERREVVRVLHARLWSDPRIADFADCDARTVLRIRQELDLEAFDQNALRDRGAA